jgi:hypothetical protein
VEGLTTPPPSQAEILELFQTETLQKTPSSSKNNNNHLTYRTAESGATGDGDGDGGTTIVEPKESLELQRCHANSSNINDNDSGGGGGLVDAWCVTMSRIAQHVCDRLQLPTNTLLLLDDDDDNDNDEYPSSSSSSLDLLRVFYYHAVDTLAAAASPSSSSPILGSSPHTDWGSWTIVWQDEVGGLETYCRCCQKWVPVPAAASAPIPSSKSNHHSWHCIVHVGDMASLALTTNDNDHHHTTTSIDDDDDDDNNNKTPMIQWPSPKHRVVSSRYQVRTSLVYFGYPPSTLSLNEIQVQLKDYCSNGSNGVGRRLPYDEYYLLHDQSSSTADGANIASTPESRYESLQSQSVQDAIQTKWNQVQRSS